jgi:RNA-directed DNA polymerase
VSVLKSLKEAQTREDLAHLLGYKTSGLTHIVYKLPPEQKYKRFTIPKANGHDRQIDAPVEPLKLLQRRLANLLNVCCEELERENPRHPLSHGFHRSHGFRPKRSIVTNAHEHRNRRYVLNLDLQDFFPSINFGRVRGFFLKNYDFMLHETVATTIAQIACHEGALPQGSPCSPILSELVTNILDVRLARLAKKHRVTYSRYADDITFSTNQKDFPPEIAMRTDAEPQTWELGAALVGKINGTGFAINTAKTRMQYRDSRQSVTGLVVNRKVNIRVDYYKLARSMCHSLFMTGRYFRPVAPPPVTDPSTPLPPPVLTDKLAPLEGILSHIHFVKGGSDRRDDEEKRKKPTAARELYRRFLFYKMFIALKRPLIVCEGKTDNIYLRYAMRQLTAFHPKLGSMVEGRFKPAVNLFGYGNKAHDILRLGGGTGDLKLFLEHYERLAKHFKHQPLAHPVIILVDNDSGTKPLFDALRGIFKKEVTLKSADPFYHITANLYLVKTPEQGTTGETYIEKLFEPQVLKTKLDGKSFKPENTKASPTEYGKYIFAEKVIKPNYAAIKFDNFEPLLRRIEAAIDAYTAPIELP